MARQEPRAAVRDPLVSVCIAHYNRPELLAQAMASIEAKLPSEIMTVPSSLTMACQRATADGLQWPEISQDGSWR